MTESKVDANFVWDSYRQQHEVELEVARYEDLVLGDLFLRMDDPNEPICKVLKPAFDYGIDLFGRPQRAVEAQRLDTLDTGNVPFAGRGGCQRLKTVTLGSKWRYEGDTYRLLRLSDGTTVYNWRNLRNYLPAEHSHSVHSMLAAIVKRHNAEMEAVSDGSPAA